MWEGIIYPTRSEGINEWFKIDKDCKYFMNTWSNSPEWKKVISRTTYDCCFTYLNIFMTSQIYKNNSHERE